MRKWGGHFFILHSYFCLLLAAKEVLRPAGDIGELDGADEVDEFAEAVFILRRAQALRCGFAF